jgi:hypothetical protein
MEGFPSWAHRKTGTPVRKHSMVSFHIREAEVGCERRKHGLASFVLPLWRKTGIEK